MPSETTQPVEVPRMRLACLVFACITLMAVACGMQSEDTTTPRPTYTPYPTFTPEASPTTGSPTEIAGQESPPGEYVEIGGRRDWFLREFPGLFTDGR